MSLLTINLNFDGKNIMSALSTLQEEVARNTTITESAVALIVGLQTKLDAAIASNDPTALQTLSDTLKAETDKLAAAVGANTVGGSVETPVAAAEPVDIPAPVVAAEPAVEPVDAAPAPTDSTAEQPNTPAA